MPRVKKSEKQKAEKNTSGNENYFFSAKLTPNIESHIKVNMDVCIACKNRECTHFCPSSVFNWSDIKDELIILHENCFECGACKSGCPYENIEFVYPKSGFGFEV